MILVTGGTGFLGSHLLAHLVQKEEKIRAVFRTQKSLDNVKEVFSFYSDHPDEWLKRIEWVQADITDVPAMTPAFESISQVYHCAALVSFDPKDYIEMRKVNIHGTAIITNLSIDAKVEKLCYVSSIAAIGDDPKREVANEENEWNGNDKNHGYAITKYGGEMEIWRASQEGVDVVIVNPGVILGSGFWQTGSSKMFTQINEGFSYYSEAITGFVGVKDVARAMIELMNGMVKNERFILVSENKSFKEILITIANVLEKKKPSKKLKKWQAEIFWRLEWVLSKITSKKPRLTKASAQSLFNKTEYSSQKIKEEIQFEFTGINKVIEETSSEFTR